MYYNSFAVALVLSIYICYSFSMKCETKQKIRLNNTQALNVWKSFGYSFYWLNVLINNNEISKAQAGLLINKGGI